MDAAALAANEEEARARAAAGALEAEVGRARAAAEASAAGERNRKAHYDAALPRHQATKALAVKELEKAAARLSSLGGAQEPARKKLKTASDRLAELQAQEKAAAAARDYPEAMRLAGEVARLHAEVCAVKREEMNAARCALGLSE